VNNKENFLRGFYEDFVDDIIKNRCKDTLKKYKKKIEESIDTIKDDDICFINGEIFLLGECMEILLETLKNKGI
jgi:hypothetical protein